MFRKKGIKTQNEEIRMQLLSLSNTLKKNHPFVYEVIDSRKIFKKTLLVGAIGCIGKHSENQKKVASQIKDAVKKNMLDVLFAAGDLRYPNGLTEEKESELELKKILQEYGRIPLFMALGNHDLSLYNNINLVSGLGKKNGNIDPEKINALKRFALLDANDKVDKAKENILQSQIIDLAKLDKLATLYFFPNAYYAVYFKAEKKLVFCMNSNTLVRDYLNYFETEENNQIAWFASVIEQYAHAHFIIVQHHPVVTVDKRALHSDAFLYLTDDEQKRLEEYDIKGTYNQKLLEIYIRLSKELTEKLKTKIVFKDFIGAHAHHQTHSMRHGVCQVVTGGGGEELHAQEDFEEYNKVTCVQEYGWFCASMQKNHLILYDLKTQNNLHLQFTNTSEIPIIDNKNEAPIVKQLRKLILQACNDYFDYWNGGPEQSIKDNGYRETVKANAKYWWRLISSKTNYGITKKIVDATIGGDYIAIPGVYKASMLKNFVNSHDVLELPELVSYMDDVINQQVEGDQYSLITRLSNKLKETFDLRYHDFVRKYAYLKNIKKDSKEDLSEKSKEKIAEQKIKPEYSKPIPIPELRKHSFTEQEVIRSFSISDSSLTLLTNRRASPVCANETKESTIDILKLGTESPIRKSNV